MKAIDEDRWQQQVAELDTEETGRWFRRVLERWVDAAQEVMESGTIEARDALMRALGPVEDEMGERIGSGYLAQMLVVIASHWVHGEEMAAGLSPVELRLTQDVLALKLAELSEQAAQ